jgi:hypothetical protein
VAASPVCRRWEFNHDRVNQASGPVSFVEKQSNAVSTDEFIYRDICRIQKVR